MWGLFPRGWRCCVPALLTSSALRFSLLLGNLLFSNFPLATTTISSLTTISKSPSPPISHFFSNNNVVYSDRSEKLKKKLAIFSKHQQQAFWNRTDTHKENIVVILCKGFHSSTKGLGSGLGRVQSRY